MNRILTSVILAVTALSAWSQAAMPYIEQKDDFGGIEVNDPKTFILSRHDYTLQVSATAGTQSSSSKTAYNTLLSIRARCGLPADAAAA